MNEEEAQMIAEYAEYAELVEFCPCCGTAIGIKGKEDEQDIAEGEGISVLETHERMREEGEL